MTRSTPQAETSESRGSYIVRRPRVSDAIGKVLRSAFGPDDVLPREIASSLNSLDRVSG